MVRSAAVVLSGARVGPCSLVKEGRTNMGRRLVPRFLAAVDFSGYSDTDLHTLASDINTASTTSALVLNSQPMQECVGRLATKDTTLTKGNKKVDDDRQALHADIAAEAVARTDLQGEIRTFVVLVENVAKSPADVHGAGLKSRFATPKGQAPTVPQQIDNKPPKKGKGKTTVVVHETGPTRHQYVAESSLDGITWAQLGVGHGKTRVVTGPSGTKVWVRFAMVRSGIQSDWSTPIMVTIP
jgi:hypothetical protein